MAIPTKSKERFTATVGPFFFVVQQQTAGQMRDSVMTAYAVAK